MATSPNRLETPRLPDLGLWSDLMTEHLELARNCMADALETQTAMMQSASPIEALELQGRYLSRTATACADQVTRTIERTDGMAMPFAIPAFRRNYDDVPL